MRWPTRLALSALIALAVAVSGCLTVFPVGSLVTMDPRATSAELVNVEAYNRTEPPQSSRSGVGCSAGSDTRTILVPQLSQRITIYVSAELTAAPEPAGQLIDQHFDLTVADGGGTAWVDIHLNGNSTNKEVALEGPRTGGWTVNLSWNLCSAPPPVNIDDQFAVSIIVREPA